MRLIFRKWKILLLLITAGMLLCSSSAGESIREQPAGEDDVISDGLFLDSDEEAKLFDETNLLYNGRFEIIDEDDGYPEGWYPEEYRSDSGNTVFSVTEDEESGRGKVAEIWNMSDNDARFIQFVPVEPDTVYCLSGYIWADHITGGHGANFSIENVYSFSEEVFDTDGEWQYVEYYGVTGPDQDLLTVFVRVGGYSGESTGKARFDEIYLREVFDEEEAADPAFWYRPDQSSTSARSDQSGPVQRPRDDPNNFRRVYDYYKDRELDIVPTSRAYLIIAGIVYLAVLLLFAAYFRGRKRTGPVDPRSERIYFIPALLMAFAARMVISFFIEGYSVDVGCFKYWGSAMEQQGPLQYYPYLKEVGAFCDYPPLYMYLLGANSRIVSLTGTGDAWSRVIFRFFPSLCDILSCCILYQYARRKMPGQIHRVCVILILFALNPAVILNSAAWGQIDSVLCLMLLMVALYAAEGKWTAALPVYALSVLVKPQALMLGILGLIYIIITWIRDRDARKKILAGVFISLVSMAAVIIPFGVQQPFGWLIEKYQETLSSYPYATVNTANFYYLVGGNWSKITEKAGFEALVMLSSGCAVYGMWWYCSNRKRPRGWIETVLSFVFAFLFILLLVLKASWGTAGTAAMVFVFIITISFAVRNRELRNLPYLGALLFILLYVFGVKMHERYVFPAIFLLAGAWIIRRDRRILYLLALLSATLFVNEGIVLDNSIRIGPDFGHLLSDTQTIEEYATGTRYFLPHTVVIADILSILNIAAAIYGIHIAHTMTDSGRRGDEYSEPVTFPDRVPRKRSPLDFHPDRSLHWTVKDSLILLTVTVIYSLISLTTLGSTKAPQTGWTSSDRNDEIIFDLGEDHKPASILYYGRVSQYYRSDFAFSQRAEGYGWSSEVYAEMNQGECFKWKYVVESSDASYPREYYQSLSNILYFSERYVKLRALNEGLCLNEIIFRDADGNIIPAKILEERTSSPEPAAYLLLDEQDTLEALPVLAYRSDAGKTAAQPSWWNSAYFDEIYHARTGYEFLYPSEVKGEEPYECSHPPLGKLLMSAGIALFGMTPFGWRFAGALAGILMIPGMYLIAKQLTKKTPVAAVAAVLMAADCMHLTQTQIATIDSFPVLFIIFAYFFMLRYMQTDIIREPLKRSLVPLAFSGLFMGLSIASKWIGIYAGAGLAVLFVWHGLRMIRISREAGMICRSDLAPSGDRDRAMSFLCPGDQPHQLVKEKLITICIACIRFFVLVPVVIYLLSYIPYMACRTDVHTVGDFLDAVWKSQINMFEYHSKPGLGADHPYYSPWYEWPVTLKPMYYAARQYLSYNSDLSFSIFSFGNPAVWWTAIPALCWCVLRWIREHWYKVSLGFDLPLARKRLFTAERTLPCHLTAKTYDNKLGFILIGLLAQFLPWILVPRGTYIYHYFASVPFMILCICACLDMHAKKHRSRCMILGALLILCAVAMFILFFPYASGLAVSKTWFEPGAKLITVYF